MGGAPDSDLREREIQPAPFRVPGNAEVLRSMAASEQEEQVLATDF